MIRIFCGYDVREEEGFRVFVKSLIQHCSDLVSIIPMFGIQGDGSNAFTYSRFLVPYHCHFQGTAIWMDGSDMLLRADLEELLFHHVKNFRQALSVVKHDYKTKHSRKYVGTKMEADNRDYPRKNWSSLIVWDCGHHMNRCLTPEFVSGRDGAFLHRFGWLPDDRIGELPKEWNWLADEYGENERAKLLHWTAGYPGFEHYANAPMAQKWHEAATVHSDR